MPNYNENRSSESYQKKSVSTKGLHVTNGKVETPCALDVSYYDDMVRIQFSPELPKSSQTENRRYDYENSLITAITRAKCNELCNLYDDVIRPAILKREDVQVGISLASVNLLQVGTGIKDGDPHPYISFYKGINQETLIAPKETTMKYEFNTGEYILGYNPETGEFKERVVTCNEIDLFFNDLKNMRSASSNAYVHTERTVNRYWKDTLDSKLNRIGEAQGINLVNKPKFTPGGGGRGSIFDNQQDKSSQSNANVVTSLNDIDEAIGALY